ncbi:MAG: AraC family transcriptional regulator [Oscillospiraceae bacterium]|nr:AraC family transcriptional regulator [Oscillospiraceae bacterium]
MRLNYQIHVNRKFRDLNPLVAGEAAPPPGHTVGPSRDWVPYIHYVRSGKGKLWVEGIEYDVHAGQIFLIRPGELATYTADEKDPWVYQWIGFDGLLADSFEQLPTVIDIPANTIRPLGELMALNEEVEFHLASELFLLHAKLIAPRKELRSYVRLAKDYIHASYMHKLTTESIAKYLGLNRSYLSEIFIRESGMTVRSYIAEVRFGEAKRLLALGYPIKETAMLCGYDDPAQFSKAFKQRCGESPKSWQSRYETRNNDHTVNSEA